MCELVVERSVESSRVGSVRLAFFLLDWIERVEKLQGKGNYVALSLKRETTGEGKSKENAKNKDFNPPILSDPQTLDLSLHTRPTDFLDRPFSSHSSFFTP